MKVFGINRAADNDDDDDHLVRDVLSLLGAWRLAPDSCVQTQRLTLSETQSRLALFNRVGK